MKIKSEFARKIIDRSEDFSGMQTETANYIYTATIIRGKHSTYYEINRYPNRNEKFLRAEFEEFIGLYTRDGKKITSN